MPIKLKSKGVKITDKGMKRLIKQIKELEDTHILVGLPGDLGTHDAEGEETIAQIGINNEFGHSNVPSRPWMRSTADKGSTKTRFTRLMKNQYLKLVNGVATPKSVYRFLGEWYVSELKSTIKNGNFVPNAEFTILNKGSSTPLIDTGLMRNSITSRIVRNGKRSKQ